MRRSRPSSAPPRRREEKIMTLTKSTTLSRRAFLSATGALVVALSRHAPRNPPLPRANGVAARPPVRPTRSPPTSRDRARRHGDRLLRQDRRRAGPGNLHRAVGGGRDRRSLGARAHRHGRHRRSPSTWAAPPPATALTPRRPDHAANGGRGAPAADRNGEQGAGRSARPT